MSAESFLVLRDLPESGMRIDAADRGRRGETGTRRDPVAPAVTVPSGLGVIAPLYETVVVPRMGVWGRTATICPRRGVMGIVRLNHWLQRPVQAPAASTSSGVWICLDGTPSSRDVSCINA